MTDPTPARIGFAAPLTGDQAIVGVPMRQCAELAVEEINARESAPFRWKLVAEDDRADPRVAVIGVVGHKNSGPCRGRDVSFKDRDDAEAGEPSAVRIQEEGRIRLVSIVALLEISPKCIHGLHQPTVPRGKAHRSSHYATLCRVPDYVESLLNDAAEGLRGGVYST